MDLSKFKVEVPDAVLIQDSYSVFAEAFKNACKSDIKGLYYARAVNNAGIKRAEMFESIAQHDEVMRIMYSNTVNWYVDWEAPLDLSSPATKALLQTVAQKAERAKPKRLVLEF